jgi:thiamine-phosphate pyrophosphorylase
MISTPEAAIIYLITQGEGTPQNFIKYCNDVIVAISQAIDDGVSHIQIREKSLTAKQMIKLTELAVEAAVGHNVQILVNERADIAVAGGADGVHLTSRSLPVEVVRAIVGDDRYIWVSTHSLREVERAFSAGANAVVFAPVFSTPGKDATRGIDELQEVCRRFEGRDVIALGGIDAGNCELVMAAGAAGIAAIRSLNDTDERRAMIAKLRRITNDR